MDIETETFDLSVKNPNGGEEIAHRSPQDIIAEIEQLDTEVHSVLSKVRDLLRNRFED